MIEPRSYLVSANQSQRLLAGMVGAVLAFALDLLRLDPTFGLSTPLWSFFPLLCLVRYGFVAALVCVAIASALILGFTSNLYGVGDVAIVWVSLGVTFAVVQWTRRNRIVDGILLSWLLVVPLILWRHQALFAVDINGGLLVMSTALLSQLAPAILVQWLALRPSVLKKLWLPSLPMPVREPMSLKLLARLVLFPLMLMSALVVTHFFTTEWAYDRSQQIQRGSALIAQWLKDRVLEQASASTESGVPPAGIPLTNDPRIVAARLNDAMSSLMAEQYPKLSYDFTLDLQPSNSAEQLAGAFILPDDFDALTPIDHVYQRYYQNITRSPYPNHDLVIRVFLAPVTDTGLRYSMWALLASLLLLIGGEVIYRNWFRRANHDFKTFVLSLSVWEPGDRPLPELPGPARQVTELDELNYGLRRLVSGFEATFNSLSSVSEERARLLEQQEEMAESVRMASLGEVATGAAHQLNQPLNIIRMAVANIRRQKCLGGEGTMDDESGAVVMEKLKRIDAQIERAAQIIEGMKAFSLRHHGDWGPLAVSDVVTQTVLQFKKQFALAGVTIVRDTLPIDVKVYSNEVAMETILQSLLGNSLDAFLGRDLSGGQVHIAEAVEDGCYRLTLSDTAGGIDGSTLDHIFEPFYTTKDISHRPGLGLAVVWRLVDEMDGSVHCENTDRGARFVVSLPVVCALDDGEASPAQQGEDAKHTMGAA